MSAQHIRHRKPIKKKTRMSTQTKKATPTQELPSPLPKRKRGRPRKSETQQAAPQAVGEKPQRTTTRRAGNSTRETIITAANEIINRTGVVDFRIEMLAKALSLSPGNITYHFARKEEIIAAIWDEYLAVLQDTSTEIITPLLDLKQLFLFLRTVALKAVNYAGVTSYYFGDMGSLLRENETFRRQIERGRELLFSSYETLTRNGYMRPIDDPRLRQLTFESQTLMLRWWINHAQSHQAPHELTAATDRYIALSLVQLHPYLTESGQNQLNSIVNLLK